MIPEQPVNENVILANKTLLAIEKQISSDQGSLYRSYLGQTMPTMSDAYRADNSPFRSHLGASGIGGNCARKVWYGFRWTTIQTFDGRMNRLFNRGHLEEARFLAMLLAIGCAVYQSDANGEQFRIHDAGGHFGGSGDGVGIGIPDLPSNLPCLLEFKTSAFAPFLKLQKNGVKSEKFEHYVQMNVYMRKMGLTVGLYMCVNKNTDELYAEIIHLDEKVADNYINLGCELVFKNTPPKKISETASFWKCKFCEHRPVCHKDAKPEKNCRTCKSSTAEKDGTWTCNNFKKNPSPTLLTKDDQLIGCDNYTRKF